jgi:hypothetical protein
MADLNRPLNSIAPKLASTIQATDTIIVMSIDGDTNQTPLFDAVAKSNEENGCLCVRTAKLDIPSAEVLTLNTTPKAMGISVPTGYMCRVLSVDAVMEYNSVPYATNIRMAASPVGAAFVTPELGGDFFLSEPDFLAQTADVWGQFQPAPRTSPVSYGDWEVYVRVGDPTAGDSDITIYLTYVLIPL